MKNLPKNVINALFELGKELPQYCAEIYICANINLNRGKDEY